MIQNIDIDISTEIFKLVNFWKGFHEALKKFASISGQYLQKGDNKIMTIYRQGNILYQKGIKDIEKLRDCEIKLLRNEINLNEVKNIIEIAYRNRGEANSFDQEYFN